jgi:regulator of RNase E activity RraA
MEIGDKIIDYIERNKVSTTEILDIFGKDSRFYFGIPPLNRGHHVVGYAYMVGPSGGSNYPIHKALEDVPEGSVVFSYGSNQMRAVFGSLVSKYILLYKKCKGIVVDGLVRDVHTLIKENYPVWCWCGS